MTRKAVSAEVRDRQRRAVELRLAGANYDVIARQLEYAGPSSARYAVQRGLEMAIIEPSEEVLRHEIARLDRLMSGLWAKAVKGDPSSVDRVLKIMDRRAKYLGLDAPTKMTITSELDESIDNLLAQLSVLPPVPAASDE